MNTHVWAVSHLQYMIYEVDDQVKHRYIVIRIFMIVLKSQLLTKCLK